VKGAIMQIEAAIFDMDGLMIDSEPLQWQAVNATLAPYGLALDEATWVQWVGRRASDSFAALKATHPTLPDVAELLERKNAEYRQRIPLVPAMPGLQYAIEHCRAAGLKLALASSSVRSDIDLVLTTLGLSGVFAVVVSGEDVVRSKPDPAIFLLAAERLAVLASRCLVFEDTNYGLTAAKAAGMYAIAVPGYFTQQQDFSQADRILSSLADFDLGRLG